MTTNPADRPLLIGLTACRLEADPQRPIYGGKALQYVEACTPQWLMVPGITPVVLPLPAPGAAHTASLVAAYADQLDGLVLHGGDDVWPGHYGETPLRPEWTGDAVRDAFEIALVRAFDARRKPILGLCRGLQLLNVAHGGSLYQDLPSQRPSPVVHDDEVLFERVHHPIALIPGTRLAALYPDQLAHPCPDQQPDQPTNQRPDQCPDPAGQTDAPQAVVNSIHHQAVKALAPGFTVQAVCPQDGTVEAIWRDGPGWVMGVQWHPEFHGAPDAPVGQWDDAPLLADFIAAARQARGDAISHATPAH